MKHVLPTARLTTLGDRLQRVNRITLGLALLIVALLIIASSFSISLFSLVDASRVKARVLAENASASLMFQDARSAQELLQSLQQSPDVHAAALYDKNRQQFASFVVPEPQRSRIDRIVAGTYCLWVGIFELHATGHA